MPRYLVMEQDKNGHLTANPRTDLVDAANPKHAIATARGMDNNGHTYASPSAVRFLVVQVASHATVELLHHLPTVATTDTMHTVTYEE